MNTETRKKLNDDSNISRREYLKISSLGLTGITLGMLGSQFTGCNGLKNEERPNILLMVADDAGWRDVGFHDSEIKTPNIDELTKTGVELDYFYVCPTCSPTRATLLTGRFASRFGILDPIGGRSTQTLPEDTITLAELLRRNGYATAITGKWHLGLRPECGPNHYGFEHAYGYLHGQIDQYTHIYKNGDQSWHRNGEFIEDEGHATDLIANEATQYIKEIRDKSKPFFLYVPFSVPHYPLQEEEKWVEPYNTIVNESRRVFAASVTHMDHVVGQLVKILEEENLRKNTLVVFVSDNGGQENWFPTFEYNGKHGPNDRLGDNRPLRDWKGSLYEGGIRVPALVNWQAKLNPRQAGQVMHAIDIYPTVAAVAGVSISPDLNIEGENMWPTISQGKPITERTLYWKTSVQFALRQGDWKLIHTGRSLNEGFDELFHISDDPNETQDVARDNPEIVKSLFEELIKQAEKDE